MLSRTPRHRKPMFRTDLLSKRGICNVVWRAESSFIARADRRPVRGRAGAGYRVARNRASDHVPRGPWPKRNLLVPSNAETDAGCLARSCRRRPVLRSIGNRLEPGGRPLGGLGLALVADGDCSQDPFSTTALPLDLGNRRWRFRRSCLVLCGQDDDLVTFLGSLAAIYKHLRGEAR